MTRTPVSTSSGSSYNSYNYLITNQSGTYKAYNGATGVADFSSASFDTVMSSVKTSIGTANPAVIELGAGTFTTVSGLTFAQSNLKIRGRGKDVTIITADSSTGVDATAIFKVDPTQSASGYPLTVNANAGDLTLTISSANLIASGLAAGDYFILYSSLGIDTEFTGRNQGELHKVISVNTGTGVITIGAANNGTHIYQTTLTANTASIAKLTMYQNISLEGITFTDAATSRANTHIGIVHFRFVDNLSVTDCTFRDGYNTGLLVAQSMNVKVNNCFFKNMKDVNPTANVFYGCAAKGATINMAITNCNFDNMRHGVVQGAGTTTYYAGITRNLSVSNCTSLSTYTAHFDVHQGAVGVSFVNNTMVGDDGAANGIQARSPATITGNTIVGVLGKGVSLFGGAHGSTVSGNLIQGCTDAVYIDRGVNDVIISSNIMKDGTRAGQFSRYTSTVTISNASPAVISYTNHILTPGAQVTFTTTGGLPTGLTVGTIYYIIPSGITKDSFQVSATEGGTAINTSSAGSGTHTIAIRSGNNIIIANNQIINNTSYGFGFDGQVNVNMSDNKFKNNTLPFQIANTDVTASNWNVVNNYFSNHSSTDTPTILGTGHILINNFGYNLKGASASAITNPYPSTTGNITNLTATSSPQAFPATTVVYTNIWSPKIYTITGGTVSAIEINGIVTGLTAGSFSLGVGETIKVTHSVSPTATVRIL